MPRPFRRGSAPCRHDGAKIGHEPVEQIHRFARRAAFSKGNTMFRKVAIALFAASMLAAPVIAQAAAPTTKPTAGATSAATVKTIKADKTALKHRKHARRHNGTHMAKHMHKNGVKHVRHFNKGNGHKVAGTANKVVSAKPATRSGNN
jgi:hypothetical protein